MDIDDIAVDTEIVPEIVLCDFGIFEAGDEQFLDGIWEDVSLFRRVDKPKGIKGFVFFKRDVNDCFSPLLRQTCNWHCF